MYFHKSTSELKSCLIAFFSFSDRINSRLFGPSTSFLVYYLTNSKKGKRGSYLLLKNN